jgi:hypothetical protein
MTTKASFMALAEEAGIEVGYRSGGTARGTTFAAELVLDAPCGKVFSGSDLHCDCSLSHDVETDGTRTNWRRAFAGLREIISQGFTDCPDRPNCDICDDQGDAE